jgi:Coenzyme PQQ synthesis protein D (PqqD)
MAFFRTLFLNYRASASRGGKVLSTFHSRITQVYEVTAGVRSTCNDDGMVLLDIMQGQVFRLNATGAAIFESLRMCKTESELSSSLAAMFSISLQQAEKDVREFLESLARQGLICEKG